MSARDLTSLEGRVALVTGSGSSEGIGFAAARIMGARGAWIAYVTGQSIVADGGDTVQELKGA